MSMTTPQQVSVSAGTCVKIGFFGALGAFLFSLILSAIALVLSLIIALIFGTSILQLFNSSR